MEDEDQTREERYAETLRKQEEKRRQIRGEKYGETSTEEKKRQIRQEKNNETIKPQKKVRKNESKWTLKEILASFFLCIGIILVVAGLGYLTDDWMAVEQNGVDFHEVLINGVTFHIPGYLTAEEENELFISKKYEKNYWREDAEYSSTFIIKIHIYKNKSLEEMLTFFKSENKYDIKENVTFGDFSGFQLDNKGSLAHVGGSKWFVFEKNGKTVAISLSGVSGYERNLLNIIGDNPENKIFRSTWFSW